MNSVIQEYPSSARQIERPVQHPALDKPRFRRNRSSLSAHGEPMVWLTGGSLAICLIAIAGLFTLVFYQGLSTFWPSPLYRIQTPGGSAYLGEIVRIEEFQPDLKILNLPEEAVVKAATCLHASGGWAKRYLIRTGNFELTGIHFQWVNEFEILNQEALEWAVVLERLTWGRFYGIPKSFLVDGKAISADAAEIYALYNQYRSEISKRLRQIAGLEKHDVGEVNRILEGARLKLRGVEMREGQSSPAYSQEQNTYSEIETWANLEFTRLREEIAKLRELNQKYQIVLTTGDGKEQAIYLSEIVRAYPANRLGFLEKIRVYLSRWWEFLSGDPREANSEGGVFPAIFGTVIMTLFMSLAVAPFGMLAALYLREYAKAGTLVSAIRIAVNNLAGVPSIVYGVFGLGFFCYFIGASIDSLFFAEKLPNPTYGAGGLIWSSLTLALLTLPVVIVATEEALAAVPGSMREGSYACGASKWQTIQRIVLPRAMPGVMTGMILAMARGAGEVAPLMMTGAVKLAPELPVDGVFPYFHPERSFMHLGFHIYDLGFQSQNSEAAKPMVFTTTLLLLAIIFSLNVAAVWLRMRLRKRFEGGQF